MIQQNGEKILSQALQLPADQRWELAERLLESVHPRGDSSTPEEWEDAWRLECDRRRDELKSGAATAIPWEEVQRKCQAVRDARTNR